MIPAGYPGPIRTDGSSSFASHTMKVRIPAIIQQTLDANPTFDAGQRDALAALRDEIGSGAVIQPLRTVSQSDAESAAWNAVTAQRAGQTWHSTDWFFAETFTYRRLAEAAGYFENRRDPFLPIKRHEYASAQHQTLLDAALEVAGAPDDLLYTLIAKDLWGNRVDLSYAESRSHGMDTTADDLLADDRAAVLQRLHDHPGAVHIVADNAGTELSLDLVLADTLLRDAWAERITLHVKYHPTFVSDAIEADVHRFVDDCASGSYGPAAHAMGLRLQAAAASGRFSLESDPYWNSPDMWWEMPSRLLEPLRASSLVFVKGDANYRRVVGDAFWPHDTPFAQVVGPTGIPVACIRTLKSDPVVGLPSGQAEALQAVDERWRWSGKRGLIQAFVP